LDAHVEPNVSAYRRNPRKLLARLGYLERLILIYSSKHSRTFMASDIVVMYGLKNLNGNANKRVHDAIKRLLRRGFIKKVDRGTYQLILDITPDLLGEHKENLCSHRPLPVDGSVGNCVGKHCFMDGLNTVRIHVVGVGGYLDLYYELLIINHFSRIAVREVESYLVRLGVSRKAIREFRKNVFCYVPSRVVVGGHGRYKCRGKHLMPFFMGFLYEYGVDIVANMPLPKMFIKVYTDNLDYPINPMLKSSS
jgi:hypothetical protein